VNGAVAQLYRPQLCYEALTAPAVAPLKVPGWRCEPYDIQTRGITWLVGQPQAYLGDVTGTGKTIHGVGLAAVLFTNGEARGRKLVFTCQSSNIGQWVEEFARFLPDARVVTNKGMTRQQRRVLYSDSWDVLITGYRLMWGDRDLLPAAVDPHLCWFDEASSFRNRDTETAAGARVLSCNAMRVICADATPIQNSLADIHPQLEVMGLAGWSGLPFGTEWEFKAHHIISGLGSVRTKRGAVNKEIVLGYNDLDGFRARFAPYYLRRTEGSADMPDVMPPEDIPVEMTRQQIEAYRAVALGQVVVGNKIMALQQICAGTFTYDPNLGDYSAKLDWLVLALQTRLVNDDGSPAKVVVFSRFLATSHALSQRLQRVGIGYGFIDGPHAMQRDEVRHRFWDDPTMRVVIGTQAMERGMNLQIAKYVITIDLMTNPARLEQILGRVKRSGSPHKHIFMLRLIAADSLEERVLRILRVKQHLADIVNGDVSDLFPYLTPEEQRDVLAA
jgi:SNF2 family DNA or RNA helicase